MASHEEVAQNWIKGKKSTGSRMFTDGRIIYSYGTHFPIAVKLDGDVILFNKDKYSRSTSKHQSHVHSELNSYTGKIHECTTDEIMSAIECPNRLIVVEKVREITCLHEAIDNIRTIMKKGGVKRFPTKKFTEMLDKRLFLEAL